MTQPYDPTESLREWLAYFAAETGEEITHLCVGFDDQDDSEYSGRPEGWWPKGWPQFPTNRAMPIDEFGDVLDVRFRDNWGADVYVCGWSPSWVLFTSIHDSDMWPSWVARNPIDHRPRRGGR